MRRAGERRWFSFFRAVAMTTLVKTVGQTKEPKQMERNTDGIFFAGFYFLNQPRSCSSIIHHNHVTLYITCRFFFVRERFPYFKANDDRWKNSVRHNLSISPHFRKSVKARTGTGHLWTLALPPSARTIAANLAVRNIRITHVTNGSLTWTSFPFNSKRPKKITSSRKKSRMKWPGLAWNFSAPKDRQLFNRQSTNHRIRYLKNIQLQNEFSASIKFIWIFQDGRNSPLTFERAAELMLAESGAGNCEGRVHVEFLARPLQLLGHMENGSCSPGK